MSLLYIFDTDHVSLFQQSHTLILKRASTLPPNSIAVTIITVEEQIRGWFKAIRRSGTDSKQIFYYHKLRAALNYFQSVPLLDFDQEAYDQWIQLRSQKIRIGTQDMRIASIAIATNRILVTRNRRDFSKVPNLQIEDWTVE